MTATTSSSNIILDENQTKILKNFLNFLNSPKNSNLKLWVKNYEDYNTGFMFNNSNEMTEICRAVDPNSELDNSTVWYLRQCQKLFKNE